MHPFTEFFLLKSSLFPYHFASFSSIGEEKKELVPQGVLVLPGASKLIWCKLGNNSPTHSYYGLHRFYWYGWMSSTRLTLEVMSSISRGLFLLYVIMPSFHLQLKLSMCSFLSPNLVVLLYPLGLISLCSNDDFFLLCKKKKGGGGSGCGVALSWTSTSLVKIKH